MILITGAARSGTSLTTRILQAHGAALGNPKAVNRLCENTLVRERILKPHLRALGADPLGQDPLPDTDAVQPIEGLGKSVRRTLGPTPRGVERAYKDAKLCLVWPAWHAAFPGAKWVIVRRAPSKIVASCLRTSFMRAFGDDEDAWREWVRQHEQRFKAMRKAVNAIEVRPDHYIRDPERFRPVAEHCGLTFRPELVTAAVDPELWHG